MIPIVLLLVFSYALCGILREHGRRRAERRRVNKMLLDAFEGRCGVVN